MLLTLNIGNTHVGVGVFNSDLELLHSGRFVTHPIPSDCEELERRLLSLFESSSFRLESFKTSFVSSVVPRFTEILRSWRNCQILNEDSPYLFELRTLSSKVGIDRLVSAEGALSRYKDSCIVVDIGTATTFSVIAPEGSKFVFLGGAIAPGLNTAQKALIQNTAQLSDFELTSPHRAIGRNTPEALLSGSVLGHTAMIEGLLFKIKEELKAQYGVLTIPKIILTGGLSFLIHPLLKETADYDPNLALRGIAYVYDRVRKREPELCLSR